MNMRLIVPAVLLVLVVNVDTAFGFGVGRAKGAVKVGPGGASAARSASGVRVGPGGAQAGSVRGGTRVTPGGVKIQAGRAAGVQQGPLGGTKAGAAQGIRVTTPSGKTYTTGRAEGVQKGPLGGVKVGGASGTAVTGPFGGGAASVNRGGVVVGPGGRVVAGGSHTGVRVGPGGMAVGHRTGYVSTGHLNSWGTRVRTGYSYRYFTPTWYAAHPVAWTTTRWATANYWAAVNYATLATYVGLATTPVVYDYGSTVVIQNENVIVNGDTVATATEYATQASQLADTGRTVKPADTEEWQPLGVFGLMQGEEEVAQRIFQLAINKAGIVRGYYYDAVADNTLPVYGSVDKTSQRVAWSIGEKKDIVFEAGLGNFTKDQTTILVHFGKESTQQMVLVRLAEPKDEKK